MAADPLGFVGHQPFAPPPPRTPRRGAVVPEPAERRDDGVVAVDHRRVTVTSHPGTEAAGRLLAAGLFRAGVPCSSTDGGYPVVLHIDASDGGPEEAYRLDAGAESMALRAGTAAGMARAAATARQLIEAVPGGLLVATGAIDDRPVVPLRMLAGWGLYRDHCLEWALEIAAEGKFNRVLYNWWAATAEERMTAHEERLVHEARQVGIELVVELRRQALGPRFSLADPSSVATLLRHYDDAVDHGFRSFGFLFDDTDLDPFDQEHALLVEIVRHLTERLGEEPEFWFCPRFYWFPGQMDYSWMAGEPPPAGDRGPSMAPMLGTTVARSPDEAAERQRNYQDALAAVLPARTHVYLANWWSGTPDTWAAELQEGWTDRIGRAPVFWDNQQQNDFRCSVVLPMPLHQRPAGFGHALDGYTLNSGVPMPAYAPASVTAGAWAWNPDGYDAGAAFGAAIARFFGPAAPAATDALHLLGDLLGGLMAPRQGMEQHYRGLWLVAKAGDGARVRESLDEIAAHLAGAGRDLSGRAHPLCRAALAELARELDRLRLDLDLAELVAAGGDPEDAARLVDAITAILAGRLPPVPELAEVMAGTLASDADVPGISWLLHFVTMAVRAGPGRLLSRLEQSGDRGAAVPPMRHRRDAKSRGAK